jgi:hypothetical protein
VSTATASLYNLTAEDVRQRFKLAKLESVYAFIRQGLLRPVNVGTGGKRPCWRFSEADLTAFVERRRATPTPPPAATRRRARQPKPTTYF